MANDSNETGLGPNNNGAVDGECNRVFGVFLKSSREAKGLTQLQVAKHLGYGSPQFISNIERGISSVPLPALKMLIRLYELKTDDVIELMLSEKKKILVRELKD